jgi:hypothetical protein
VTTSSGKPPFDETPLDSSWDAGSNTPTGASGGSPDGNAPDSIAPDSASPEPLTPRQPPPAGVLHGANAASPAETAGEDAEAEPSPIYGTGVPYGGDEHTEEIDPVALDTPFVPEQRKLPAPAAQAAATPKAPPAAPKAAPAAQARGFEMKAPAAQMLLSDLFDSVPSSSALSPPDPAAFTSSRPPPERPPSDAPPPGRDAIIALPNINVGSDAARSDAAKSGGSAKAAPAPQRPDLEVAHLISPRVEPEVAHRSAPRAPMPTPPPTALPTPAQPAIAQPVSAQPAPTAEAEPPVRRNGPAFEAVPHKVLEQKVQQRSEPDPEMSTATVRLTPEMRAADPEMSTATQRLQPDFEMSTATVRLHQDPRLVDPEMSTATIKLSRDMVPGLGSSPSNSRPSNAPPRAPMPSSPALPSDAAPSDASDAPPGAGVPHSSSSQPGEVARFPSEVPTSRPPDVALPATAPASFSTATPVRAARESKAPQSAVTAPAKVRDASQLPSIMLAADVEAEPDSAARRALRAARATVRLELPPGFGRPGGPGGPPGSHASSGTPIGPGSAVTGTPAAVNSFLPSAPPVAFAQEPWFANPRTRRLLGAALAGLLLFVTLMFALSPRSGSLVVTALAPGNRAVDDVTIFIDGRPLCDVSPCRIKGLTPGMHTLRASAPNLASQAEETVEITAGDEATYNIDLLAVAPEVRSGGMRVPATEVPLTLFVDGKRVGKLPQEVSGLSAGKHWIKLDPEDGSSTIEKSVNVLAGEIVDVEPKAAKRDKALVTIRLGRGSEGAQVTFDDAFLLDFPAEMELEPNTVHTLAATKPGYEDLTLDVEVADGETEKLIEVSLTPLEGGARKSRPAKVARKPATKPAPTTASTALADATQGLLNISSVPPSQIILNGRPLGSTPKTGITVPGDSLQTIVFVHPKMGRRRAQKFVPAGKERTVSIRF